MESLIREHLRCVICHQLFPHLMQCYNGHAHCQECLDKCQAALRRREVQCSLCRSRKAWTTNRQMYQLAVDAQLTIACGIEECKKVLPIADLETHRTTCPHIRFACPVSDECLPMQYDALLSHALTHPKVTRLANNQHIVVCISETCVYGPRVLVHGESVIKISCTVFYDRKFETRLIVKASVIGHKQDRTTMQLCLYQWNMLNEDYAKYLTLLSSDVESVNDEVFVLTGMNNYVQHDTEGFVFHEQIQSGVQRRPKLPIRMMSLDVTEECQEVHTITFAFRDTLVK